MFRQIDECVTNIRVFCIEVQTIDDVLESESFFSLITTKTKYDDGLSKKYVCFERK